jgi:hypothetical protein
LCVNAVQTSHFQFTGNGVMDGNGTAIKMIKKGHKELVHY